MSYVDAIIDKDKNTIFVAERSQDGQRVLTEHPTKYVVYWPSDRGKWSSIHGVKLDRFQTNKGKEFQRELGVIPKPKQHESDINPIFRCLYDNYRDAPSPNLHVGLFDIETDFDPLRGFSSTEDAFSPITAISVWMNWLDRCFTLAIKPKTMSKEAAQTVCSEFPDTMLCDTEKELLDIFLTLIEDCDILSGWNSEGYDIPYIYNRIVQVLGKSETARLCLWGKYPKKREYESYGRQTITYDLVGRVHLDYLQLYRKHTYHEMHTYRLDAIGEYEVGERKTQYEGTLDQLYNNDFKKFIEYNRQDVLLLAKIDAKLKFIELANNLAHTNCVLLQTTMGAVALIDQSIVNAARDLELIVPARIRETEAEKEERWAEETEMGGSVVGAYVADPKPGMHDWIGGVDINSLYPSVIRALNMSPETIVGHIRPITTEAFIKNSVANKKSFADSWNGIFGTLEYQDVMELKPTIMTVDFEDGTSATVTAKEIHDLVWKSGRTLTLSANGTIFDYSKPGLIPGVLTRWFAERKQLQAEYRKWAKTADDATDPDAKAAAKKQAEFHDQRQLIKKILLNSLYGAIGNPGSRWYDPRVAQSTTLCGRCIVKHMSGKINEIIAGEYNHVGKAIVYGDTDSAYFTAYTTMKDNPEFADYEWTKENVIDLYDKIADMTNASFPDFMAKAFGCPEANGKIIKAARELCAIKGLFITKKRYAVLIYDKEGKRKDQNGKPGEIKAMGLDLKRSDTPKTVQDFLQNVLVGVLTGADKNAALKMIMDFRKEFRSWDGWLKGSPKRANNITNHAKNQELMEKVNFNKTSAVTKKVMIPGHVLASLNWNKLKKIYGDHYSMPIQDGQKVIVCKLKPNPSGMTSVAYPTDELKLPQWFKDLPFDHDAMEEALIDKKIDNLLGVLKWNVNENKANSSFEDLFSF